MKKLLISLMALVVLCACNSERGYLDYRGLPMNMSAKAMCDSFMERGFAIDSALCDSGSTFVLKSAKENFRLDIHYANDTITDILESYEASYNDSTSSLWQQMRDQMEKDVCRPYMTHHGDLHKEAVFQTDKGTITLTLLNTYTPTLTVHYSTEIDY